MPSILGTVLVFVCVLLYGRVDGQQGQQGLTTYVVPHLITTPPSARYSLLLRELATITNGRKALQAVLTQYRGEHTAIKQQEQAQKATCNCYNKTTIAFTAHLNKNVATLGINQPIPFDNVTINSGNAYDARHAQFRAPVNGTYQFYTTLTTNAGYYLAADVLLNGVSVQKLRTGNGEQFNTATNGLVLHMAAGDDLWVQHDKSVTDSNRLWFGEGMLTSLTGHLLFRD